jgi:hypothetical protein
MSIVSGNLYARYYSNQEANLILSTEMIGGGGGGDGDDNLQKKKRFCNLNDGILVIEDKETEGS